MSPFWAGTQIAVLWGMRNWALLSILVLGFAAFGCGSPTDEGYVRSPSQPSSSTPGSGNSSSNVPEVTGALNFGGFYSITSTGQNIMNPLANNTAACPTGFTATQIFGSVGPAPLVNGRNAYLNDQNIFLCSSDFNTNTIGAFGGFYSPGFAEWNIGRHDNAVTNAQTCPTGFTASQIVMGSATDAPLYYCYADLRNSSSVTVDYAFGGIFGARWDADTSTVGSYSNPATASATCPTSFTPSYVYGTQTRDYRLTVCLQPQGAAHEIVTGTRSDGSTPGLLGAYYNGVYLDLASDVHILNRMDAMINFAWGSGVSPAPRVNASYYRVQWTGYLIPRYSETYTFTTHTDDGVRLIIDGTTITENWGPQNAGSPASYRTGTVTLTAGRPYAIQMDYYNGSEAGVAQLSWQSAHQAAELIPASQFFSEYVSFP